MTRSVDQLAARLTKDCKDDSQKVGAIHHWITSHIKYDVKKFIAGDLSSEPSKKVLKKRKATCVGYSNLFYELCTAVDIPCFRVEGLAKSYEFDMHRKSALTNHVWNAYQSDGRWYLLDATWDSGYIKYARRTVWGCVVYVFSFGKKTSYRIKPTFVRSSQKNYFQQTDYVFIYDHFPALRDWQLSSNPKTYDDFINDSAFYYFRRPNPSLSSGFTCPSCDAIAAMDSLQYMMAMGEEEFDNDSLNPRLLALKKTRIAEMAYHPKLTLSEKETNRRQFVEADSLNRMVLALWKQDKVEANRFNDLKGDGHNRYHKSSWAAQKRTLGALDEMRSAYSLASKVTKKRAISWDKRHQVWQKQIDGIKYKQGTKEGITWQEQDSLLQVLIHRWDSLMTQMNSFNAQLSQLCDNQYTQLMDVDSSDLFITTILQMQVLRRRALDDLDYAMVYRDSLITRGYALRLRQIQGMQTAENSKLLKQLLKQQKTLMQEMQRQARLHKSQCQKWTNILGNTQRREQRVNDFSERYAASAGQLKEFNLKASDISFTIAKARPELRRGLLIERRLHQRDHNLELKCHAFRSEQINDRYHSVYSVIKTPQRLSSRRIKLLDNDIKRLKADTKKGKQ
jgi:hypothetical protein